MLVSNNTLILSYSIKENWNNLYPVIVLKANESIDSLVLFRNGFLSNITKIMDDGEYYYFIGKTQAFQEDSVRLFLFKSDHFLNPIDTVIIKPFQKNLLYFQVLNELPDIKVVYVAEVTSGSYQKAIYSVFFSIEGDILSYQQAPLLSNFIFFTGLSEIPGSGNTAINGFYTQPNGGMAPCVFLFNDSLTYQKKWIYPPTEIFGLLQYGIQIYSNTTFLNDTLAYITARAYLADTVIVIPQNYQYYMKAMLADTSGHVYKVNAFGAGDTTLYPAFFKHQVATEDNHFYVVWTKNIEVGCIPYCPFNSWIGITYLNDSLDVEWEQFFGGDDFYTSHIAEPSPDGGIVVAGTRYRFNDPGQPHEVIIISVSPEGVVTGTSSNQPIQGKQAIVYPNPGDTRLMVEIGSHIKKAEFSLFDINGKLLLTSTLTDKITEINTEQLSTGVYIYSISNESFRESGKWIKQ